MKKTIPIILLVITLGLLTIYGFFSPYNYLTAQHDIRMAKFKRVSVNMHPLIFIKEDSVDLKYGFELINIETKRGNDPISSLGIKSYNRLMKDAYIKSFGESRYESYRKEINTILKNTFVY
jgi:hypothetical protein